MEFKKLSKLTNLFPTLTGSFGEIRECTQRHAQPRLFSSNYIFKLNNSQILSYDSTTNTKCTINFLFKKLNEMQGLIKICHRVRQACELSELTPDSKPHNTSQLPFVICSTAMRNVHSTTITVPGRHVISARLF